MSFSYRYDIGIFAALLALVYLACTPASVAGSDNTDHAQIDLAKLADGHEISTSMLAIPATKHIYRLDKALEFKTWVQPNDNNLEAPRQHSTTWLKATLSNSSEQALIRWLVLEPWRLKRVEAFFFRLDSTEILRKKTTGLVVPLKDRSVNNGKTIIPIELNAGESQELYLKVYSDSMPFLSIKNWDPVAYSQNLHQSRLYQVGLFAAILMLLAVLVLQFNTGLIITGLWLLVAFVFESEKDGFFSNYLLSFLEAYSANIRITAWILTEYLFLVTSVFLLGFKNHRSWRVFLALMFLPVLMIASLSFVLDGVMIRNLGILAASPYAISWLFMAGAVLRSRRPAELSLLVLLFAYWSFSTPGFNS